MTRLRRGGGGHLLKIGEGEGRAQLLDHVVAITFQDGFSPTSSDQRPAAIVLPETD